MQHMLITLIDWPASATSAAVGEWWWWARRKKERKKKGGKCWGDQISVLLSSQSRKGKRTIEFSVTADALLLIANQLREHTSTHNWKVAIVQQQCRDAPNWMSNRRRHIADDKKKSVTRLSSSSSSSSVVGKWEGERGNCLRCRRARRAPPQPPPIIREYRLVVRSSSFHQTRGARLPFPIRARQCQRTNANDVNRMGKRQKRLSFDKSWLLLLASDRTSQRERCYCASKLTSKCHTVPPNINFSSSSSRRLGLQFLKGEKQVG